MNSNKHVIGLVCLVVIAAAKPAKAETPAVPAASPPAQVQPVAQTAVKGALVRKATGGIDLGSVTPGASGPVVASASVQTHESLGMVVSTAAEAPTTVGGVALSAPAPDAPTVTSPKPPASMRALRRMNADHVFASLQPSFQACYAQGGSHAKGMVALKVIVAATGEVESTETLSSDVGEGVVSCVAARMHEAHFNAPGGTGLSIQLPVQLGL